MNLDQKFSYIYSFVNTLDRFMAKYEKRGQDRKKIREENLMMYFCTVTFLFFIVGLGRSNLTSYHISITKTSNQIYSSTKRLPADQGRNKGISQGI